MHYELAKQGSVFSTRPRAVGVLGDLQTAMLSASPDEPLLLDFAGVRHVSFSFADEFIGTLVQRAHDDDVELPHLVNLDEPVRETIVLNLSSRDLPVPPERALVAAK